MDKHYKFQIFERVIFNDKRLKLTDCRDHSDGQGSGGLMDIVAYRDQAHIKNLSNYFRLWYSDVSIDNAYQGALTKNRDNSQVARRINGPGGIDLGLCEGRIEPIRNGISEGIKIQSRPCHAPTIAKCPWLCAGDYQYSGDDGSQTKFLTQGGRTSRNVMKNKGQ